MAKPETPDSLAAGYASIRRRTVALTEPLSAEDCCVQSMPDASPAKWHLAHTSWFFETFILERHESPLRPLRPQFPHPFQFLLRRRRREIRAPGGAC